MRDEAIIELYFARNERAIDETRRKYGGYCSALAQRLLGLREDAEECVQDTYLAAWNTIPPERPNVLRVFLGRITRNLAISRWRKNRAAKRYAAMELQLDELADCVPSETSVEREIERREMGRSISDWLDTLPQGDRDLFIRRYWYAESPEALGRELGMKPNTVSQRLRRLRLALRDKLEKEEMTDEEG